MTRAVLQACLPWLAVLAVSVLAAWLLVRASRAGFASVGSAGCTATRPGRCRV